MNDEEKPTFEIAIKGLHYTKKTKEKIIKMHCEYGQNKLFGRTEVMNLFGVSSFTAGKLIKKMKERGIFR